MLKRHGGVRTLLSVAVSLLISGGALAMSAQPAAASLMKFVQPTSWAYTDSRNENTAYVNTNDAAPVGSWRDDNGKHHKSRSYFTFDLSSYRGKQIKSAVVIGKEVEVNDCESVRRVEIWRTDAIGSSTTWSHPPTEQAKLAEYGQTATGCPSSYLGKTLTDVVREAVATGNGSLTLELRVPEDMEGNLHLGRKFSRTFGISIDANTMPNTPTELTVDQRSCDSPDPILTASRGPVLGARVTDDDINETGGGDLVYSTIALWPVSNPSDRREFTDVGPASPQYPFARVWLPWGYLQQDGTYAFQVKSHDSDSETGWSAECRFTLDTVRPPTAPGVTSTDYPENEWTGGAGIPGDFTFSSPGVDDLAGFYYGFFGAYTFVAAGPGGSVTLPIIPDSDGPQPLYVAAVDKAGNRSDQTVYWIYVRSTAPEVVDEDPDAWAGDAHRLTFHPSMDHVVSYTYQVNYGPDQVIAADADGVAHITVTPELGYAVVTVRSTTAAGLRSGEAYHYIFVSTSPIVTSPDWFETQPGAPYGSTGSITFKPHMHGVVEYVYNVDDQPAQTVAAGADGSATISFTPLHAGRNSLMVYSRTADGTESEPTNFAFDVASLAPTVESPDFREWQQGGGIGVTSTFTFRPTASHVVEYLYSFDRTTETAIAAGADGSATISWTPRDYSTFYYGQVSMTVRSRSADGFLSDLRYFSFYVNPSAPEVVSNVQWPDHATVGQPSTFYLTAQITGSVEFVYSFDYGTEQVIAAGPDGKATITFTPGTPYGHNLTVRSRNSDGLNTGSTVVYFSATE